jgi:hypothetical protein
MNDQPKSRPINGARSLDDLFPTRFLKADQLLAWKVTEITVTILKIQEEEVEPKPGQREWKPVIYFKSRDGKLYPQGYLLSAKVDKDALKSSTSATTIDQIIGKQITIRLADYRGRTVLRIDPTPEKPAASTAPAAQQNLNPDPGGEDPGW